MDAAEALSMDEERLQEQKRPEEGVNLQEMISEVSLNSNNGCLEDNRERE